MYFLNNSKKIWYSAPNVNSSPLQRPKIGNFGGLFSLKSKFWFEFMKVKIEKKLKN